jgi:hypothetical protein
MSDFENHLSSSIDNEELALSKYEDELERIIQDNLTNGQDLYTQKLFLTFQNAATNVTKMFRGKIRKLLFFIIIISFSRTFEWNK